MATTSSIEWTEMTWNPVTGCHKVSQGCKHCYAERMAKRLHAMGSGRYRNGFEPTLHEDLIDLPKRWRKPRIIFVNSMSDLFQEEERLNHKLRGYLFPRRGPIRPIRLITTKELLMPARDGLFRLGRVVATPAVLQAIDNTGESLIAYLSRHCHGDWGELTDGDKQANIEALAGGTRILSAYHLIDRTKIWIITEADRSSTCILLPSEY